MSLRLVLFSVLGSLLASPALAQTPKPLGSPCAIAGECQSGQCVDGYCSDQACTNPCFATNLPGRLGRCSPVPLGQDPGNECPGVSTCDGAGGCTAVPTTVPTVAPALKANGVACAAAGECASGICADGVCSDQACTNPCFATNLPGSMGRCSPVPLGQDPGNECPGTSTCDGAGRCTPYLTAVSVTPATVIGAVQASGLVTLSSAPVSPFSVALASSDATGATVAPSVAVAAGQTTAGFPVNSQIVPTGRNVSISANAGGVTKAATLTVRPAESVATLTLQPATLAGGATGIGQVTLTAPASTQVSVKLSSANAAAAVPASVIVPAGAPGASFNIVAGKPAAATTVKISASFGGATKSATLTVTP